MARDTQIEVYRKCSDPPVCFGSSGRDARAQRTIDAAVTSSSEAPTRQPGRWFETRPRSSSGYSELTEGPPAAARRDLLRGTALSLLPLLFRPWVASAFAAGPVAPAVAPGPLRIVYDVFENPPLICGNGTAIDPTTPGLTIELLRMASAQAKVPIELSRTPWKRGLYLIETGQADAIFASSFVEERQRYGVAIRGVLLAPNRYVLLAHGRRADSVRSHRLVSIFKLFVTWKTPGT